ncbi:glycosyltransferase family 2 protein [Pasteurella skyensis]|uniref:Glycosyltransferase family 2 protein n=1 Tax=Phocoenobacter skyensis TaxID=97481 RepID=A0AAJ6P1W2_9PAST|nr:glycosyltransferase family 2 protein [Pasteurella skyensis]MDP8169897.1 glycosyltransferase family 2 protein [Pasteurella skyensis]MDP8174167.1 glycosyltransferase family 2 protein [Pasteurella skyensis]
MKSEEIVAIIPHYNHSQTILNVVEKLTALKLAVMVIDDGSSSQEKEKLSSLLLLQNVQVIYRTENGGKGAAVKEALNIAFKQGFQYALQVDADGQHNLDDIPQFFAKLEQNPTAIICGKPIYGKDAPKARVYGRKITDFWNMINTLSTDLKDGMCGFRLYPLNSIIPILSSEKIGERMDFDTEILVKAHWYQIPMLWVDTPVKYAEDGISHFQGFRDNLMISKMHARLFFKMLQRKLTGKAV